MTRRRSGYLRGGWQTGEVWLDPNDVHWFGEARRAAREAFDAPLLFQPLLATTAGAVAARAPALAPRPFSSRQRRLATRLAPTVAAVATVGLSVPFALNRLEAQGADLPLPPVSPAVRQPATPILPAQEGPAAPSSRGAVEPAAPAVAEAPSDPQRVFPAIRWRESRAIGVPHDGRLVDGVRLPQEGPGWTTWDPARDRRPNRANRLFGTDVLVRVTLNVIASYRLAHPAAPTVLIGDLSLRGGGEIDEHASHENGLDVDIYYPRRDRSLRPPRDASQVDLRLAQDLVDRFVAAGAQVIFVGTSVPLRGLGGVVVPYPNHNDHFHVRIDPQTTRVG